MRRWGLAAVVLVGAATGARADDDAARCAGFITADRLESWAGSVVAPTGECGGFVVATDTAIGAFSWGAMVLGETLPARYQVSFTWQRLGGDGRRTMEVHVGGGAVLFQPGRVGFYESEPQLSRDGWIPLAGYDHRLPHDVTLAVDGATVRVAIDGAWIATRTWSNVAASGERLRLALKGYPGLRSRMLVRRLRLTAR